MLFSIKHRLISLCFYKVKQTRKVNLASEIMTKILRNEMEFWHVKHGFRSVQLLSTTRNFLTRNSHIKDFHIEPIFLAQHSNNFGFIKTQLFCNFVQFKHSNWSKFEDNFILTTSFCDYLNQFARWQNPRSFTAELGDALVGSKLPCDLSMACPGSVLIGAKSRHDPPSVAH